jgi:hypothetical protein
MGFHSFFRKIEDQVKNEAENLDDWQRDSPYAALIPFTQQNQKVMGAGAALLGGAYLGAGALGAAGGGAAGAGAAGAGAATGGGMSLGTLGLGLGSIGASLYGANQAKKGVNAQIEAGDRAAALEAQSAADQLKLQREIWEKQQADYKPYLEQGTWGINRLGDLMRNQSANPKQDRFLINGSRPVSQPTAPTQNTGGQLNNPFDSYLASKGLAGGRFDTNNPAYQFQLKQGQQALDRSSAARGMGYSGAQMKASQEYGQGLASQQYDKEYNRASGEFGDYFNRLAGLAQGGQQAAGSMAQAGGQYANNASNTFGNLSNAQTGILGQQANARASGYAANANAVSGGLNSLTNLYAMNKYYG